MKIALDITKSLEENAAKYFESAKKSRKKIKGVDKTLEMYEDKKEKQEAVTVDHTSNIKKLENHKKYWFEKFRWFITSEGFLVIGGRDATTNEIVVKKHTDKDDIVFHTDMAGSPFVVIKKDVTDISGFELKHAANIGNDSIVEAASFTVVHSKVWKTGMSSGEVFWVEPSQVSKEANTGEYMEKGSFMIRGKTNYVKDAHIKYGISVIYSDYGPRIIGGPISSLGEKYVEVLQGDDKPSNVAKKVRSKLKELFSVEADLDDIIRVLPAGGCKVKK